MQLNGGQEIFTGNYQIVTPSSKGFLEFERTLPAAPSSIHVMVSGSMCAPSYPYRNRLSETSTDKRLTEMKEYSDIERPKEVSVQVEPYTDEQMLIALADENAGKEESVETQVDVIRITRKYLKEHPGACKMVLPVDCLPAEGGSKRGRSSAEQHKHGSQRCLLAFIGDKNWNEQKISSLLSIADRFDASLLRDVANDTHPESWLMPRDPSSVRPALHQPSLATSRNIALLREHPLPWSQLSLAQELALP